MELIRMKISVTSSISSAASSSITPICLFAIPLKEAMALLIMFGFIPSLIVQYSTENSNASKSLSNTMEISGIHRLSFKWEASCTAKILLVSSARGLKAILMRSLLKSSSRTSLPAIAAMRAVTRCCPSISTFFPLALPPSLVFTSGFFQVII